MMNKLSAMPVSVNYTSGDSLLVRFFSIIPAALVVTLCLLYAMHSLVHKDYLLQPAKPTPPIPDVAMKQPEIIETILDELPQRPVEHLPPPIIEIQEPVIAQLNPGILPGERMTFVKPIMGETFSIAGQMVPIIRIAPQYPQAAIARGVEGYVDVMFDVTALGTTENIRILAAVPSSIFNRSVVKAVSGWKYKPNVVDGVAVKTQDVKDRVRFNMEQ